MNLTTGLVILRSKDTAGDVSKEVCCFRYQPVDNADRREYPNTVVGPFLYSLILYGTAPRYVLKIDLDPQHKLGLG